MHVMLCQSDLILLHKWGLDDSQSHTTVDLKMVTQRIKYLCFKGAALHKFPFFLYVRLKNLSVHMRFTVNRLKQTYNL